MKMQGVTDPGIGYPELQFDDLLQGRRSENMEILLVAQQAQGIDQSHQAEIMVAVEMGNEYMGDLASPHLVIDQLYLRSLAAVHQVVIPIISHYLAGRMPVKGRNRRIISKYRNGEHEWVDSNLKTKKTKTKTIGKVLLYS